MTALRKKESHVWGEIEDHWFVEPVWVTMALCQHERFVGQVHDPSCGQGNIIRALRDNSYNATGSDLRVRGHHSPSWFLGVCDFMDDTKRPIYQAENYVMNPPYFKGEGTERFIRRALELATGKVCAFVEKRFLSGKARAKGLYTEHPPHRMYFITPRPSCPPGQHLLDGGKASGGTQDFCWLVWDNSAPYTGTTANWMTYER